MYYTMLYAKHFNIYYDIQPWEESDEVGSGMILHLYPESHVKVLMTLVP